MDKDKTIKYALGCLGTAATSVIVLAALAWGMRPFYMPHVNAFLWDGSETFVCDGNDDVSMSDKKASISNGPAIEIRSNCHVSCKNCELKGDVGIQSGGNGQVRLEGGSVEGATTALDLAGNTRVEAKDVKVTGGVAISVNNNASAVLRGGEVNGTKLAVSQKSNGKGEFKQAKVTGSVEAAREANVTGL